MKSTLFLGLLCVLVVVGSCDRLHPRQYEENTLHPKQYFFLLNHLLGGGGYGGHWNNNGWNGNNRWNGNNGWNGWNGNNGWNRPGLHFGIGAGINLRK